MVSFSMNMRISCCTKKQASTRDALRKWNKEVLAADKTELTSSSKKSSTFKVCLHLTPMYSWSRHYNPNSQNGSSEAKPFGAKNPGNFGLSLGKKSLIFSVCPLSSEEVTALMQLRQKMALGYMTRNKFVSCFSPTLATSLERKPHVFLTTWSI